MYKLKMKRVYDKYEKEDGYRLLVDRIWPRGVRKVDAQLGGWEKDITPSTHIRKEFNHCPEHFQTFKTKYLRELNANPIGHKFIQAIKTRLKVNHVTFIYAAKDPHINHVVILKEWITDKLNEKA